MEVFHLAIHVLHSDSANERVLLVCDVQRQTGAAKCRHVFNHMFVPKDSRWPLVDVTVRKASLGSDNLAEHVAVAVGIGGRGKFFMISLRDTSLSDSLKGIARN